MFVFVSHLSDARSRDGSGIKNRFGFHLFASMSGFMFYDCFTFYFYDYVNASMSAKGASLFANLL